MLEGMKRLAEEKHWAVFLEGCGYSRAGARSAAKRLIQMDPQLKKDFVRWSQDGSIPQTAVEEFDIPGLTQHRAMTVPAAFLTLDWLLREPEQAKTALADLMDEMVVGDSLLDLIGEVEREDRDGPSPYPPNQNDI